MEHISFKGIQFNFKDHFYFTGKFVKLKAKGTIIGCNWEVILSVILAVCIKHFTL